MRELPVALALLPLAAAAYAYVGYPLALRALAAGRRLRPVPRVDAEWPMLTITMPAFNAASSMRAALEHLLAVDYPPARRQIIVISDASTDGTDDVVLAVAAANPGIELLRLPVRRGKTAAESAAGRVARGAIIVNVDATVRLLPHSLKPLIRAFQDPTVGVASGRDLTAAGDAAERNAESAYVRYEMWLRDVETRLGGIVGASGCFYGFRRELHQLSLPEDLSRDFACALIARERGFRSVAVPDAVCVVPQTRDLDAELERKARTMKRGLDTLWYMRRLMNPVRYGGFALKLISHKLCRWLVPPLLVPAAAGLLWWGATSAAGTGALALVAGAAAVGVAGMRWPRGAPAPRPVVVAGYLLASMLAGLVAWTRLARGRRTAVWQPTSRPA